MVMMQMFSQNPLPYVIGIGILLIIFIFYSFYFSYWSQASFLFAVAGTATKRGVGESMKIAWSKTLKYSWTISVFGLLLAIGFVFFIIPFFLFLAWFSFSLFVLTDENLSGATALLKSYAYVKGRTLAVLGRLLCINVVGIVVYGALQILSNSPSSQPSLILSIVVVIISLATILLSPLFLIYEYVLYRHVKERAGVISFAPTKKKRFALSVLPIFMLVLLIIVSFAAIFLLLPSTVRNASKQPRPPFPGRLLPTHSPSPSPTIKIDATSSAHFKTP